MSSTLSLAEISESSKKGRVTLYEEFRLIEKNDSEIHGAWKGIHLLLFFLAFIFGSFCTFCFHVLTYLFDEKCVLFPKLISLKEMKRAGITRNKLLYEFITDLDALPVDFVSTHWVDQSICYLPTYVPLVSGISGLIWTTMFLMCTTGNRSVTGLQRSWRILPTVFIFSLAMGGLCVYTSCITQDGLNELCAKLAEVTGSDSCSYTINVATLAYERRIRGVFQATRLTIISAWIHTICWLGSAVATIVRIVLVVDFRLVKVRAELLGNVERMLERHEKHIRTDDFTINKDENIEPVSSPKVRFKNKGFGTEPAKDTSSDSKQRPGNASNITALPLFVARKHKFIVEILHNIVDSIGERRKLRVSKSDSTIKRWNDFQVPSHGKIKGYAEDLWRKLDATVGIRRSSASTATATVQTLETRSVQTEETEMTYEMTDLQATSSKSSTLTLKPVDEHDSDISVAPVLVAPVAPLAPETVSVIESFLKCIFVNENELTVEFERKESQKKEEQHENTSTSQATEMSKKESSGEQESPTKEKPQKTIKKEKQD